MKICLSNRARAQHGSAVLVVLALLGCIALFLHYNSKTLYILDQDIKLLDRKQQVKYGPRPMPATNHAQALPGQTGTSTPQPGPESKAK